MIKEVIQSSGLDFIRLDDALFFMVAVLTDSFMRSVPAASVISAAIFFMIKGIVL